MTDLGVNLADRDRPYHWGGGGILQTIPFGVGQDPPDPTNWGWGGPDPPILQPYMAVSNKYFKYVYYCASTIHNTQQTINNTQYTIYNKQYAIHNTHYTLHKKVHFSASTIINSGTIINKL